MPKKGNTKSNGVGRSNSSSKRKSKNIKINVLPTKKTNNEGCMDYFCGKKYFIGICVIFLIVYLVAFFSVIRRHNRVISYLHKKEDQLTEKWDGKDKLSKLTATLRELKNKVANKDNMIKKNVKSISNSGNSLTNVASKSNNNNNNNDNNNNNKNDDKKKDEVDTNSFLKSVKKDTPIKLQGPTVDCSKWKLSDVDTDIEFPTFFNAAALKKQESLKESKTTVTEPYISPWLYIVVPVIDPASSKLRTTIRSIFNELNSAPGGLYDEGVVQILIINMGGNSNVAMTLSILKDEIKDYPFASAFTFVRTIGQHENAPKSTSGEEDDKNIFQNTCFMELKLPQKVVELTSRGIAFLSYLVPRIFKKMKVKPCHAFLILKPGETICQFGLPFVHYALGKADEYNWDWTSLRMSYAHLSGTAFRCDVKQNSEMAEAIVKIGDDLLQEQAKGTTNTDGKIIAINEQSIIDRYMDNNKEKLEPMVFKQTLLAGKCNYRPANPGFDKNRCSGTDISPCDHSQVDSMLRYASNREDHIHLNGDSKIVLGTPGQSCSEACDTQTNEKLKCSSIETAKFNNCYNLRGFLNCQSCLIDIKSNGISGITSSSNYANGICHYHANTCVYAKGSVAGCGGKDIDTRRVCACSEHGDENSGGVSNNNNANIVNNNQHWQNKKGGANVVGDYGESCETVCRKRKMICIDSELQALNNCQSLLKLFKSCSKCDQNEGKHTLTRTFSLYIYTPVLNRFSNISLIISISNIYTI